MDLVGKLLIAPPNIVGNFWSKTTVLVTEHNSLGSSGIILNKRSRFTIKEFFNQCNIDTDINGYIYVGGPVKASSVTLLHSSEWTIQNTKQITNELSISSTNDLLERLSMGDCPEYWRLIVGMCVWNVDQLESEIIGRPPYNHEFSWLTVTPSIDSIFELGSEKQWESAIERSGKEFAQNILA